MGQIAEDVGIELKMHAQDRAVRECIERREARVFGASRVVELVDLCDYTYREAAEVLEVPVGTVMSRLFRARRMLEEALADERETAAAPKPRAVAKPVSAPRLLVPAANEAPSRPSEPARAA